MARDSDCFGGFLVGESELILVYLPPVRVLGHHVFSINPALSVDVNLPENQVLWLCRREDEILVHLQAPWGHVYRARMPNSQIVGPRH